jgi:hypothetical protein
MNVMMRGVVSLAMQIIVGRYPVIAPRTVAFFPRGVGEALWSRSRHYP